MKLPGPFGNPPQTPRGLVWVNTATFHSMFLLNPGMIMANFQLVGYWAPKCQFMNPKTELEIGGP